MGWFVDLWMGYFGAESWCWYWTFDVGLAVFVGLDWVHFGPELGLMRLMEKD